MQNKIQGIMNDLKLVNGLNPILVLDSHFKEEIINLEGEYNHGVKECLNRKVTLLVSHNSNFREPIGEIVIKNENGVLLPSIPFPEVNGKYVVSSSPSKKVHNHLKSKLNLNLKEEEATLLIGFDI